MRLIRTSLALLALSLTTAALAAEVVVYSARNEQLIKPLFDAYTKETGVTVKFVTDKEGPLMARLKAEGANTPADLFMTVDAGNLWQAAEEGLLQPVDSKSLQANIPAHLRDPGNEWFGLSVRARTIIYNPNKVKPGELSSYEDLADPKWKGRLCLRTSKKVYNQSLVAMMIKEYGEPKTEQIVRGWVANLATDPLPDDTKAMEAVAAGLCDVTLVNTYYFGRLMEKKPNLPLAIFWPNQNAKAPNAGVHVNVSGAGVTRHAKRRQEAIRLLEWLASDKAQNLYADVNLEYPVNPKVKPDPTVAAWGSFRQNLINVAEAGRLQTRAVMLMDRAGYK
ncbi:iron(III) transport system substrate-binding protein [Sulfuritortus calidifontis]|uniref:Iron(III) transport system substrate-binding protein n=1 Tax=Sulfuritortus calidifontis TaxID=1914471 RepID=A0A4R3JTQ4_9PROT|nr:Fe(3+) ABC transporter substrate-binding protein [Sulfuritortus calidifontis]TCS70897.1 iron(III) transport system substrate-binding protein [Sulfuritortus calidifontis]